MRMKKIVSAIRRYTQSSGLIMSVLALEVDNIEEVTDATVRALYVEKDGKWTLDVTGIPKPEDNSGLRTALQKERDNVKREKEANRALEEKFGDLDPVKARELMKKFENDDEMKLIASGKEGIDKVIEMRTEKLRADHKKQLEDAEKKTDGALEVAATFMDRVLDNHVRAAAGEAGVHKQAIDDVLLRARRVFSLNDEGNAVQFEKDSEEEIVLGKDGKTPYSVGEWLDTMKESAPHWFPAQNRGGGAGGNNKGKTGDAPTISRSEFDAKAPDERSAFLKGGGKIIDS